MMPRTLFAKLALTLTLVLVGVGLLYALLSTWLGRHYQQEFLQNLNRDLAANLVTERRLVQDGVLNQKALKETFHHYMVVNPSIEIYLLDQRGAILSYSADPGKVKRSHVDIRPVQAFIRGDALPLLGDDPRNLERSKVFSATILPSVHGEPGYLYVVLRGEEYARIEKLFHDSLLVKLSGTSVIVSLLLALGLGLLLFRLLTRRLNILARQMQHFSTSHFNEQYPYPEATNKHDEIEQLGRHYNRMAARIQRQLQELQQQDELRRELVTHVSHDLRTPLAALQGYIETLRLKAEDLDDTTRTAFLDTALQHSRRLTRLVDELFELSKLDAHDIALHPEHFSAAELVQDVLQKFQLEAAQKGIRLHMDCPDGLPFVDADIALIERVLENLLGNAIRHVPPQGEIVVSLRAVQDKVYIDVRDDGPGIAEADREHIFERLYRGGNKERSGDHAGLGLAIARQIIELHDGDIAVSSEPGRGAVFSFPLPVWGPRAGASAR